MDYTNKLAVITGESITIDGGMNKLMIYHGDCGGRLETEGE